MKIKHEHIREAVKAWADCPGGEKIPASEIVVAYRALGMTNPSLYDDAHPDALSRNTQKIFRWIEGDTRSAIANIQALMPAIEKAMPNELRAIMRAHSSELIRDVVKRKERADREWEAMLGAIIALADQVSGSGPAGSGMRVH
ncbi:toxin YdaT family protein [Rahnella sp. ChDrAdgB13]|uniref:toxin YdaT family protein n=1 Tax=Rahnella sp. ChDrAdgB13 TaxID=1850581 RepID=UPI001AD88FA8|nr:toxin YdaT family protein [Rahnella sp. ChDrAdgB13]